MIERNNKTTLVLVLSLVFILIFLGFVNACVDFCNPSCGVCGDGHIGGTEQCDKGLSNGLLCWAGYGSSCTYCSNTCQNITITNYCGDGIKQECEECDDGNKNSADGCSSTCKMEKPIIDNPNINPQNPSCSDNLKICATVISTTPLVAVEIQCTAGTTNILKQFMIKTTGNEYCKEFSTTTLESKDRLNVKCEISASNMFGESKANIETTYSCPPVPTCDHNISIRYNYADTFNTGIGIGENGVWLNDIVNITKDKTHSIKYRIENNKEVDDTVHIVVKADNNIVSEYNQLINEYHPKTLNLDISNLQCNAYHTISVNVTSDGKECDLSDNYASRQIYVACNSIIPPIPSCDDSNACTTDSYNGAICLHDSITCNDNNASTTDSCNVQTGCIYTPIIIPPIIPPCNGEGCCTNNGFVQLCDSNWKCSPWSQCLNGVMTRKCTDTNNCDIGYNKPYEQTNCKSGVYSNALVNSTMPNNFWIIAVGIILFIVLLIILINML
jgi:cysteine-rich repeat protein